MADEHAGHFDLETSLWTNDINDPNEITSYFMIPETSDSNHTGFDDKQIETLFTASQSETDPAKRAEQYKQIQQKYAAAAPIVFLLEILVGLLQAFIFTTLISTYIADSLEYGH